MITRALLSLALLVAVPPASVAHAADRRSCLRGGAALEAASGPVRVVRVEGKRAASELHREKLLSCWSPTGRRRTIGERAATLDARTSSRVEIVGRRYVGVITQTGDDFGLDTSASVFDARTGRRLHTSSVCDGFVTGDANHGPLDVAFLAKGGMALVCDGLLVFPGARCGLDRLEPAGTRVGRVAVARYSGGGLSERLFWTVDIGDRELTKSTALPASAEKRCQSWKRAP